MSKGNEYILGIGQHSSVVRVSSIGRIEYLELQSATSNGWKTLSNKVLKDRFGAQKSWTLGGTKVKKTSSIIPIDKFKNDDSFKDVLGYINTSKGNQMKGTRGSIK